MLPLELVNLTALMSRCRAVLKSRNMRCEGVLRHSIPELVETFVLKSRTETDARTKVIAICVLISRTNFSRNFVRVYVQQSGISLQ
jgi:hypothetical protein